MSRALLPWLSAVALMVAGPVRGDGGDAAAATQAAEQRRLVEEALQEHTAELGNLAAVRRAAAFRQTRTISSPRGEGSILAFHPLADGGLVIATGVSERYGERSIAMAVASLFGFGASKSAGPPANRLVWLDAAGAERQAAPLPFACNGVTVAPDGGVIAVGDDRVVVFSAAGEQVAEASAPHFSPSAEELVQLRVEIAEQHSEQVEARRAQFERITKAMAELEAVPEEERTPRQNQELAAAKLTAEAYETMLARVDAADEKVVEQGLAKARTIHRVAASCDHLFLVANEPAGYGFGVWRCGRDFAEPVKIIDGLSGCCGQMDVQVIGNELVIAENARHHVAVYGFDGEPLRTFGKASRTDIREGFGGCCNPMNACAGPDGSLLLSESNGLVKQFAADGTLVDILGAANVSSGCKNSSIGLSADGSTLYYLDVRTGRVLVLEKRS